jgi:predicted lipoprotein with Yx(FWY)xxD motif
LELQALKKRDDIFLKRCHLSFNTKATFFNKSLYSLSYRPNRDQVIIYNYLPSLYGLLRIRMHRLSLPLTYWKKIPAWACARPHADPAFSKFKHMSMKRLFNGQGNLSYVLAGAMSLTVLLGGCDKDDDKPAKEIQLTTNATLGNILTDKSGHTLYFFASDAAGQNSCTGGCEVLWPVFNVDNLTAAQLGDGLSLTDFTTTTTASSKKQLVYKGRPLYQYAPVTGGANTPEAAGATGGEGFGNGNWYVAKTDYSVMLSNAQLVGHDGKNYTSAYVEGVGKTLYFTDARGVTLYTFSKDKQNTNTFTKADLSNNGVWPIYENDKIVVPSFLDKTLFGSITVFGKKQLTYKGWPLYFFGQDAGVMGANKGISFPTPGIWPAGRKDMAAANP